MFPIGLFTSCRPDLTQVPSFELDAPPTGFTKLDFEISESMDAQRNLF